MPRMKKDIAMHIEHVTNSLYNGPKEIFNLTQEECDYQDSLIASGKTINDNNATWFCDGCGETMNFQIGFTCDTGRWTCTRCGFDNDVSPSNITM